MPFSIVQTRGPKWYAELSIVPDSWVQGTSHKKTYLFWPNVKGNIQHLITNDNSVPEEGWTKQEYNAEDLEKFEKDLDEEEYYTQVVSLLKQKNIDKDINNRMLATLDALFDRSFLTKCTWTGISKSGTKIAMHSFINVVNLFKCVGSTNLVPVTDETVRGFFMNRLKHALERSKAKGLRKSTSHKRKLI
ncbi:uncharacterized protein LOC120906233 [Anopheles arabiensis]|uniref:uncharacterized protein LOC120906233 n=1 Tax=Anopheles arabiensis TaxID=7173 RepID=UPI001AAD7F62|nr:uncharacterized protein LOC120906233 [Anopheles arabiensis]